MNEADRAWEEWLTIYTNGAPESVLGAMRDGFLAGFAAGQASRTPGPATAKVLGEIEDIVNHATEGTWTEIEELRLDDRTCRALLAEWPAHDNAPVSPGRGRNMASIYFFIVWCFRGDIENVRR